MFLFGQLSNSGCHQNMSVPLLDISFLSQCLDLPAAHSETQSLTPWFCFLLSSLFVPFLFLTFIVIPNSLHLSSCTLLVLSHQALSCLVSCPCPVASSPLINLLSSLITISHTVQPFSLPVLSLAFFGHQSQSSFCWGGVCMGVWCQGPSVGQDGVLCLAEASGSAHIGPQVAKIWLGFEQAYWPS